MWRGALRRRGQVHAAFWGPGVFLDEKAVRASHLRLLSGWVASARVVYSGQTEAYTFGFAFARACGFRTGTADLWCAGWAQAAVIKQTFCFLLQIRLQSVIVPV